MLSKQTPSTGMSYQEIGQIMGISPERVRQIEAAALKKLKHPKMSRSLKETWEEYNLSNPTECEHSFKAMGEISDTNESDCKFSNTIKLIKRTA